MTSFIHIKYALKIFKKKHSGIISHARNTYIGNKDTLF